MRYEPLPPPAVPDVHLPPFPTGMDLIAFLDSQRVTIAPLMRPDGSGWELHFDYDAHVVSAWGPKPGYEVRIEKRCATLSEAVDAIRRFEQRI